MRPALLNPLLLLLVLTATTPASAAETAPAPVLPAGADAAAWSAERTRLLARWEAALGSPGRLDYTPEQKIIDRFTTPDFRAIVYLQRTGDSWQKVLLAIPLGWQRPTAGVVVPFYDPDRMCGYDLKTKARLGPERNTAYFALHLVRQGYVVAACEAYPFNLLTTEEQAVSKGGMGAWRAAAAKLAQQRPEWTGTGKLTYDTRKAIDLLAASGYADPARLALMGHSLGGKMAFYAGCLDPRVRATVASDFGIGWDFTNWQDDWYFGKRLKSIRADGLAHQQLLACMAPRAFFLIAGQYDHAGSRPYLDEARKAHALCGAEPDAVAMFDHHSGHQPSWDSLRAAYVWLARQTGMPKPDLAFLDAMASEQAKAGK